MLDRNLFILDEDIPRPKQLAPTYAQVRSNLIKLAMDSYKSFRKGAFTKKLSRKQRKQLNENKRRR